MSELSTLDGNNIIFSLVLLSSLLLGDSDDSDDTKQSWKIFRKMYDPWHFDKGCFCLYVWLILTTRWKFKSKSFVWFFK